MMQIRIQHACVCRLQSANRVRKFMDKGEVTISTARLLTECQLKEQRSKRASRSLSFLLFFVAYAVAVFLQRNGERGEMIAQSMLEYFVFSQIYQETPGNVKTSYFSPPSMGNTETCTNHLNQSMTAGCGTLPSKLKGFMDIVTLEEFWDWTQLLLVDRFYKWRWENGQEMSPADSNTWMHKIKPISGIRIVQRRAVPGVETQYALGGGCWNYNEGRMRAFAPACYDDLSFCADGSCVYGQEDRGHFGTFTNSTKYSYRYLDTGYTKLLYPQEKGFFVMLPSGGSDASTQAKLIIDTLKADRWIDQASQWLRLDFMALNANERLLLNMQFVLLLHVSALVEPIAIVNTFQVNYYDLGNYLDVIRLLAEILVVAFWIYNVVLQVTEVFEYKKEHQVSSLLAAWRKNLHSETHSLILDLQLLLAPVLFILWTMVSVDPHKGELTVQVNKALWKGQEFFGTQLAVYSRAYFIVTGIMFVLFVLRSMQLARINPRFSLLSDSIDQMKVRLLNFAVVLVIFLVMFACMGVVLFGDKVSTLSNWGFAFVVCVEMLTGGGGGGKRAKARRGGGEGVLRSVEYNDLYSAAPRTAWLWYYSFFAMMSLVVVNIVIAIIGESYARAKEARTPESGRQDMVLAPSEIMAGAPTGLMHQMQAGLSKRFQKMTGNKLRAATLEKYEIAKLLNLLPESWDSQCSTAAELQKAAEFAGLPFNDHNIKWMIERYPCIINNMDDLGELLLDRVPPPPGNRKRLEDLTETMENVVNRQASIHAKLDLLVRMAAM